MKLVTWNVNGIRAAHDKGLPQYVQSTAADIVCLQETKAQPEQYDVTTHLPGYFPIWNSAIKKGYSGTLILSKEKPLDVRLGLGFEEHDQEGRVIAAEFADFWVINVYTPNSQDELRRLPYRQQWDTVYREYVAQLAQSKPVLLCGDFNVAHQEIDLARPNANRRNPGFTDEEREGFSALLQAGFTDLFRHVDPSPEKYTWWSYRAGARAKNIGWRIDYWLASTDMTSKLKDCRIRPDILGSDHCPVEMEI